MQLLIHHTTRDPEAWKTTFADDRENQGKAGLSMLQLWQESGKPNEIWALFEVSDRDEAQPWIERLEAGMMAKRGGITEMAHHFLDTA